MFRWLGAENKLRTIFKPCFLFSAGGSIYILIETIYRTILSEPPTHWTMFIVGGIAFLVIGKLNEHIEWSMPFQKQVAIGTGIILGLEFISGCILNLWLGLNIWDYSDMPFNLLGQICLPFAVAWAGLTIIAIILDDYLRYWIFGEEKPRYYWHK